MTKAATVALVVSPQGETFELIDIISDDHEITLLQSAVLEGEKDPLEQVYTDRERRLAEDEEFGNYVEDLLSNPFLRHEIQQHGLQWLKSKIRIEEYQRTEVQAARIIADYAFRMFTDNPKMTEFSLAGPSAVIRVRVFVLNASALAASSQSNAA